LLPLLSAAIDCYQCTLVELNISLTKRYPVR
jgi:hypothetical protein